MFANSANATVISIHKHKIPTLRTERSKLGLYRSVHGHVCMYLFIYVCIYYIYMYMEVSPPIGLSYEYNSNRLNSD